MSTIARVTYLSLIAALYGASAAPTPVVRTLDLGDQVHLNSGEAKPNKQYTEEEQRRALEQATSQMGATVAQMHKEMVAEMGLQRRAGVKYDKECTKRINIGAGLELKFGLKPEILDEPGKRSYFDAYKCTAGVVQSYTAPSGTYPGSPGPFTVPNYGGMLDPSCFPNCQLIPDSPSTSCGGSSSGGRSSIHPAMRLEGEGGNNTAANVQELKNAVAPIALANPCPSANGIVMILDLHYKLHITVGLEGAGSISKAFGPLTFPIVQAPGFNYQIGLTFTFSVSGKAEVTVTIPGRLEYKNFDVVDPFYPIDWGNTGFDETETVTTFTGSVKFEVALGIGVNMVGVASAEVQGKFNILLACGCTLGYNGLCSASDSQTSCADPYAVLAGYTLNAELEAIVSVEVPTWLQNWWYATAGRAPMSLCDEDNNQASTAMGDKAKWPALAAGVVLPCPPSMPKCMQLYPCTEGNWCHQPTHPRASKVIA